MDNELLQKIGLSEDEGKAYQFLLGQRDATAGEVIKNTGLKRGTGYNVLKSLATKKLIKENTATKVARFSVNHPTEMQVRLDEQAQVLLEQKNTLAAILPGLVSQYNLTQGKPSIRFYEGIDGIKQIYDDILAVGEGFCFVRNAYEPVYQEKILPIVEDFIKKRVAKKIKTTALAPIDIYPSESDRSKTVDLDKKRLMDRTWVDSALYDMPVEINIYGNKIALISFAKELVGMIIESPQISQALRQLFALAKIGAKTKCLAASLHPTFPLAHTAPQSSAPSSQLN